MPKSASLSKSHLLTPLVLMLASGCSTNPPMQEMSDARQSVEAAEDIGAEQHAPDALSSAQQLLSRAESDIQSGEYEEAQKDAVAAREAARQALAITQAKNDTAQQEPVTPAPMIEPIVDVTPPLPATYVVEKKDNLWDIAAKPSIYGDAHLWPLLLKANTKIIADADLIYPGQTFTIERKPTPAEIEAAINHATHHRGTSADKDSAYLHQYQPR